jgi:hypothetical protein
VDIVWGVASRIGHFNTLTGSLSTRDKGRFSSLAGLDLINHPTTEPTGKKGCQILYKQQCGERSMLRSWVGWLEEQML